MFDRQLLLIDTDRSFEDSLRRHLATHRVGVHAAGDAATGARLARELMPDLVVVAVELPKREGFATFNKLRKTVGDKVPIAIVTASVPAADLEQHRELASGADAYLDRRALNATDLAAALAGLLRAHEVSSEEEVTLDMEEAEPTRVVSIHDLAGAPVAELVDGAVGDPIGNPLAELDDAEADAAFAAISSGSAPKSRPFSFEDRLATQVRVLGGAADELGLDELPPERVESTELRNAPFNPGNVGNLVALEQENAKLRHDLDAARAGTGAPVSREKDFKHLRDLIAQKDRDADELRDELEHREQDIKSGRDKVKLLTQKQKEHETSLLETEEQLVETRASLGQTTAEGAAGLEREKGLRTRIDAGQQELKLAHEEATGLKRRHLAAAQAAGEELDTERLAHERSRAGAAERIAALEAQSTAELEALDGQRQAQLAGQRRELEEQRMVALADAERERDTRLAERDTRLAESERQHAEATGERERHHAEATGERERQHAEATRALERHHAEATGERERQHAEATGERERQHAEATRALDERHTAARVALESAHAHERAESSAAQAAATARTADEHDTALRTAEERRRSEQREATARHDAALTALAQRREDDLGAQASDHAARSDADRSTFTAALAAQQAAGEDHETRALDDSERRRVHELAALDDRRTQELSAADERRAHELGRLTAGHDAEQTERAAVHAQTAAALRGEITGLEQSLADANAQVTAFGEQVATRDRDLVRYEEAYARAKSAIADRDAALAEASEQRAARDARLVEFRADIADLEVQKTAAEEQVLRAHHRVRTNAALVHRAKQALAVALTVLDETGESVTEFSDTPIVDVPVLGDDDDVEAR